MRNDEWKICLYFTGPKQRIAIVRQARPTYVLHLQPSPGSRLCYPSASLSSRRLPSRQIRNRFSRALGFAHSVASGRPDGYLDSLRLRRRNSSRAPTGRWDQGSLPTSAHRDFHNHTYRTKLSARNLCEGRGESFLLPFRLALGGPSHVEFNPTRRRVGYGD